MTQRPSPPITQLELNGLLCTVQLGWSEPERSVPQEIRVDVQLKFAHPPQACFSDELDETICYDQVAQRIRAYLKDRPFRLIEQLGWSLYENLRPHLPRDTRLKLKITKRPPIPQLEEGASFTISDENPQFT